MTISGTDWDFNPELSGSFAELRAEHFSGHRNGVCPSGEPCPFAYALPWWDAHLRLREAAFAASRSRPE